MVYKYIFIENLLYNKLYSRELVDYVFYFFISNKPNTLLNNTNNVFRKRLNSIYNIYIENYYKNDGSIECKIVRCTICKNILYIKYIKIYEYIKNTYCESVYKLLKFKHNKCDFNHTHHIDIGAM